MKPLMAVETFGGPVQWTALSRNEVAMRWTAIAAIAAGMGLLIAAAPADAAPKKRGARTAEAYPGARYYRGARPRARITVRRPRSFLDPGTEVQPYSQPYTDYALPLGYYPVQVVGGAATPAGAQNPHWPAPGAFHPWPP
jgi:hypothetical protein